MNIRTLFAVSAFCALGTAAHAGPTSTLKVTADRLAADRVSLALVASGHVNAVSAPTRLLSDSLERDTNGVVRLSDPTMVTTCTNELRHLHWRMTGEVQYEDGEYVLLKNAWVHFYELPVLWLPYWYYPVSGEEGLSVMPGYTGRWGAYLLTKYKYHIAGDRKREEGSFALWGNTRFDLRWEQGIALGETIHWQLGDFGTGKFKIYYAWDQDDKYERGWTSSDDNYQNWGSLVPEQRYGIELEHRWEVTERDTLRVRGGIYSDSYFPEDYVRRELLMIPNAFMGGYDNELAWEHVERRFGVGASVSGPLNQFYTGTCHLPEFYFDVAPMPLFGSFVNYETETRAGYLKRQAARYGDSNLSAYSYNPGMWANYEAFRLDTYHRLTAPFKVADMMSVVPRLAYRGTLWSATGDTTLDGLTEAGENGASMRSIFEAGVTFAGRGTAWINDAWQHMLEPYVDVLAQEAWYAGLDSGSRPYVFDSIDASCTWEDQFAGRSRNLPYSWYGATPGVRNAFRKADAHGNLRTVFDIDAYVSLQCNDSHWVGADEDRKLAEAGEPNYGRNRVTPVPGGRLRWFPAEDMSLSARGEYDVENEKVALAQVSWRHELSRTFEYHVLFSSRNCRWWDFGVSPYDPETMSSDEFNQVHFSQIDIGFEHELCDAIAWGPRIRWDCKDGELDTVGAWIDYRTDCLGFRLTIDYLNEFERVDGSRYERDFGVGFFIYLRAFGPNAFNPLAD